MKNIEDEERKKKELMRVVGPHLDQIILALPGVKIYVYDTDLDLFEVAWGVCRTNETKEMLMDEWGRASIIESIRRYSDQFILDNPSSLLSIAHQLATNQYKGKVIAIPLRIAKAGTIIFKYTIQYETQYSEELVVERFRTSSGVLYLAKPTNTTEDIVLMCREE